MSGINNSTILAVDTQLHPPSGASIALQQEIHKNALYAIEQSEGYAAYMTLLHLLQASPANNLSLTQEVSSLYDKIFYLASDISRQIDGTLTIVVPLGSMVRLNDKVPIEGLATVPDLRNSKNSGILFSGVGAISIKTQDGIQIPLLRRDSGAPSDAGKYTLPAGRADKSPGLTAYEEVLEEIVIFGKKEEKTYLIVPYMTDGGISQEKAMTLVNIARSKFIQTAIKDPNLSEIDIMNMLSAECIVVPMFLGEGGELIRTSFQGLAWQKPYEVIEDGIFPIHDEQNNTYEMVRSFSLDLNGFTDFCIGDGDGFGRDTRLFSLDEIKALDLEKETVTSLRGAIALGIF